MIPRLFTCISFYPLFIRLYLFLSLCQSKFTPISFIPISLSLSILRISTYICFYLLSIHLYFFIPLCQSILMPTSSYLFRNPNSHLSLLIPISLLLSILRISTCIFFYLLCIHLYLFLSLVYLPLFLCTSLSIEIDAYLFLSLWQSKFTVTYSKLVSSISVYSLYIHLYLFLSLVYLPLFLYTSLSIEIDAYLFLSLCQSKFRAIYSKLVFLISVYSLIYPSIFFSISCLSISISLYLFVNRDWCLPHSISLSIQIHSYIF